MKLRVSTLAFLIALTACGGGADARCAEVVDDAMDVFQELISAVDELDLADLADVADSGGNFAIPGIEDMERRADRLQSEAAAAGCDDEELRGLLSERVGSLEARTVFGQAVIEGIRQQGLFGDQ